MGDLIGKTLGKYQIVVRVGRGGMARVYKAYQASLDRYVALKVLHKHLAEERDFIQRFEREATAVARLRHPNIVQVYDYDVQDELYYIVMEFVEGPTLKAELNERMKRREKDDDPIFDPAEIVPIVATLADAIDYAHSKGMIHRDLKPGNIMFTAEGQILLTDFGLARMAYSSHQTRTGALSGTPAYMAPEQVEGHRVDERSDVYALGIVLYEMMCGRVPFLADTAYAVMTQHVTEPVPSPSQYNSSISENVEPVLLRVLKKDPDERYQSAGAFSNALRETLDVSYTSIVGGAKIAPIATLVDSQEVMSVAASQFGISISSQAAIESPYRGLYAFMEEDAPYFFGRELFTERLIQTIEDQSMAAVIGPSGSGKSSVVFAGLLPHLRASGKWIIIEIRPGSRPFYSLASALMDYLDPDASETERLLEARQLATALRQDELELPDVLERISKRNGNSIRPLLVVDQFEELYTLCVDEQVRHGFPNCLFKAIAASHNRDDFDFSLVLTLRADFMGQALADRPFADALQDADVKLGPMTRAELR
jgi:serine/threonine protein kinase